MSSATDFWQENQVGGPYATYEESVNALIERNRQFPLLNELMPTNFPGKRILDFGCGPGHDTLQFRLNGASYVYFADVSLMAMSITAERLQMHGLRDNTRGVLADDTLPEVDHVHCAGVLHHMHDPIGALARLRAVSPQARVMVYDGKLSEHSQSLVPITEWWTPQEFCDLAEEAGWKPVYQGSYECSAEWRPNCWAACYSLT